MEDVRKLMILDEFPLELAKLKGYSLTKKCQATDSTPHFLSQKREASTSSELRNLRSFDGPRDLSDLVDIGHPFEDLHDTVLLQGEHAFLFGQFP